MRLFSTGDDKPTPPPFGCAVLIPVAIVASVLVTIGLMAITGGHP